MVPGFFCANCMLDDDFPWFLYGLVTECNIPDVCLINVYYFILERTQICHENYLERNNSTLFFHHHKLLNLHFLIFLMPVRSFLDYDSQFTFGSLGSLVWHFTSNLRSQVLVPERHFGVCALKHEIQIHLRENILLSSILILLILFNGWHYAYVPKYKMHINRN